MSRVSQSLAGEWPGLLIAQEGGVVTVTINRPSARNAMDASLLEDLTRVARALRRDETVNVVILTGQAEFFSAGVDLKMTSGRSNSETRLLDLRATVAAGPDLCQAWEEIEAVTIAAIEGFCIGGACALALACDFRIMAEGAFVRLPEVPLGMNMSWRTLPRLTSLVGPARAKRFVLFGDKLPTSTCVEWGMADLACAKGDALITAHAWAERISSLPPIPVRMTKEAINAAAFANAAAVSFMDRDQYLLTLRSEDLREGVSAFLEKRSPSFKGN